MAIILQDEDPEPPRQSLKESLLELAEVALALLVVFLVWGFIVMWSGM